VQTLDDIQVPIGKTQPTLLSLIIGLLVLLGSLLVTLWISGFIERRLDATTRLDSSLRAILARLIRAVLLIVGGLIALEAIGFDLTLFTVFGGAVGVGIGLGLQRLAANYVSGFTILLDRSIRLGDMITVDNRTGTVSVVTSRYVVVRGLDGLEAIVPNEMLVTTTVLNHSYTSKDVKLGIPVQISYDSDLELAMRLMTELAAREPRVLKGPLSPAVNVLQFAENGIDLELAVWLNDPEKGQGNLKTALNIAIWKAFRDNGIRIPYPQREVHIVGRLPGDAPETSPPA